MSRVSPSLNDWRFRMDVAAVSTRNTMDCPPTRTSMMGNLSQCFSGISCAVAGRGAIPNVNSRANSGSRLEKERVLMAHLESGGLYHRIRTFVLFYSHVLQSFHAVRSPLLTKAACSSPSGPRGSHPRSHP